MAPSQELCPTPELLTASFYEKPLLSWTDLLPQTPALLSGQSVGAIVVVVEVLYQLFF